MKNLKVSVKLLILTAMSILIILGIGGYGYFATNNMSHASSSMYGDNLVAISTTAQIRINNRAIDTSVLELMLTTDEARNESLNKNIGDRIQQNMELTSQLESMLKSDEQQKALGKYKEQIPGYSDSTKKVVNLAMGNLNEEAYSIYVNETSNLRENLNTTLSELSDVLKKDAEKKTPIPINYLSACSGSTLRRSSCPLSCSLLWGPTSPGWSPVRSAPSRS